MSVYIINHVDKHTNVLSRVLWLFYIYTENIDIWFTDMVSNKHKKYTVTDLFTALFSGYFMSEATAIQGPQGCGSGAL